MIHDNKKWITIEDAKKITGYSSNKLYYLMTGGKLPYVNEIQGRHRRLIDMDSLSKIMFEHKSKLNPYGEVKLDHKVALFPIYGFDHAYATSSDQRIFNLTDGIELSQVLDDKYLVVTLMRNDVKDKMLVHRLIGQTQCDNVLNRQVWHHINGKPTDNRPSNLIALENSTIHNKLHSLMRKSKKEYQEAIKVIQKENKQTLYKIPDDEMSSELFDSYYMVKKEGYDHYKKTGEILLDQIVRQYLEYKGE